jgi:glycosyltransferase involved in cell wall biosynthesis
MRVSMIVSTYNHPRWLELALWGYASQRDRDFELLIADDGSGPETAALIDRMRAVLKVSVNHVWHEDNGFRKTEILNRAILAATGDYIVFSDGDCIPRDDFIATHRRLAAPRTFLSGTIIRLTTETSERITPDDITSGRFADRRWLRANGYRKGHALRLIRMPLVNAAADLISHIPITFDANNVSTWKEALIAVNGFDHEMRYGWEDRSLGDRLRHYGYRGRRVRHRAVSLHLDHPRPYRNVDDMVRNLEICDRIRRDREIRAPVGIAELAATAGLPLPAELHGE